MVHKSYVACERIFTLDVKGRTRIRTPVLSLDIWPNLDKSRRVISGNWIINLAGFLVVTSFSKQYLNLITQLEVTSSKVTLLHISNKNSKWMILTLIYKDSLVLSQHLHTPIIFLHWHLPMFNAQDTMFNGMFAYLSAHSRFCSINTTPDHKLMPGKEDRGR